MIAPSVINNHFLNIGKVIGKFPNLAENFCTTRKKERHINFSPFPGIRNRFPGKENGDENVEDIPISRSENERKRNDNEMGLVAFLSQPQDPASLGVFRVFFGNSRIYHLLST
jgi:hypothetical protein